MSDRIDPDTERRKAEQARASSMVAAPYFAPFDAKVCPDTISKSSTEAISASRSTSHSAPILDKPKNSGSADIQAGLNGLNSLITEGYIGDDANTDDLLHALYLMVEQSFTDKIAVTQSMFTSERAFFDALEKERTIEMKQQIANSRNVRTWENVEKSLFSVALIASGIFGIATGWAPLGVAAIAVGTLMIVDQLLDDKAKKAVAAWMAKDNKEDQETWVNRLQFFCAATSIALSLGLAAPAAVNFGMNAAKTAVTGVKNWHEWKNSNQKALMIELEAVCLASQKRVDSLMFEMSNSVTTVLGIYENMHNQQASRHSTALQMLHKPGT